MLRDDARINGWKVIAAYLGRDRATVIRWAGERGLPVRRVPGGKTATVFALTGELDLWLAQTAAADVAGGQASSPASRLPSSAQATALFIDARDQWAYRTAGSILAAIGKFEQLIALEPDFAPAYVGLADARLAAADYGTLSDELAYGSAAELVRTALSLDPDLIDGHRTLGLIAYWWEHNPVFSGHHFRRAIDLDPADAHTRFWYGGVLADNGEYAAALAQYNLARFALPGSLPVQTHLALLKWHQGDCAAGKADLLEITVRNPLFPLAWYFLGLIRLGEADCAGYLEAVQQRARLRGEPRQLEQAEVLDQAWQRGGDAALMAAAARSHMAVEAVRPYPDHVLAACCASLSGDRDLLIEILQCADRYGERWGAASLVQRMKARFVHDSQVTVLLEQRESPRMEPLQAQ